MRAVLRGLGELLVTAGAVVLLFVGYLVVGTGWEAARDQAAATAELERSWAVAPGPARPDPAGADPAAPGPPAPGPAAGDQAPSPGGSPTGPAAGAGADATAGGPRARVAATGAPLLRLHVPRFGPGWAATVLEGTGEDVLARGPGHYPGTALPGERGNVAVAGHRVGRGAPFDRAGTLESCDPLVLEDRDAWWVYRVLPFGEEVQGWGAGRGARPECRGVAPVGVPGREIVAPSAREVLAPAPGRPGAAAVDRLLTLTTCHPRFSARQRLVVHAVLVRTAAKTAGPPAELGRTA